MCVVFLNVDPGSEWPLVVAAVRDEFADRPWSPPAAHWPDLPDIVGPRDETAGGTWLAVDERAPALALVVNRPLTAAPTRGRRTRGDLPLIALHDRTLTLRRQELARFDGFHLLLATADQVAVWTWDGHQIELRAVSPGRHWLVPPGLDADGHRRVTFSAPGFARIAAAPAAWPAWHDLLADEAVPPEDERALLLRREIDGRVYASGAASLVALSRDRVRHDFSGAPHDAQSWQTVTDVAISRSNAPS
jgi:transport and Golgi organization protein 2